MADFAVRGGHALRLARQTLLESRVLLTIMLSFLVHFPYFGDFSGIIADTFLDFAGLCARSWPSVPEISDFGSYENSATTEAELSL